MTRLAPLLLVLVACQGNISGGEGDDDQGGTADGGPGTPDGSLPGTPDATPVPQSDLEFCVTRTNEYRAMVGKAPVARSMQLEDYANEGAMLDTLSMTAHGHFSDTNGGGISFAENTCPSWLGWNLQGTVQNTVAECLEAFWSEGPGGGHYENMIGNYGTLGCGIYLDGSGGITIMQDFGQ